MAFNPLDAPLDYILLGGKRSPGIAEIVGASSIRNWDERKGYGLSGAFNVFKGKGLAKFSVKLRFYTTQDWLDWQAWKPVVDQVPTRRGGNTPDSGYLDIWHPILEDLGIKAVGVVEVGQPEMSDETGEWTVTIKFIEWCRPVVALAKPEGAKATPVDPVDQKIEQLAGQVQRLAAE